MTNQTCGGEESMKSNPRRFIKGMLAGILAATLMVAGAPAAWAGADAVPAVDVTISNGDLPLIMPAPDLDRVDKSEPEVVAVVSGKVVDPDDEPVAGVSVNLYSADTGYGDTVLSGKDGSFRIKIPAGQGYDLFVNTRDSGLSLPVVGGFFQDGDGGAKDDPGPDGRWTGGVIPEWDRRTLMDVGADGLADVAVRLAEGSLVTGRVLLTDGTPVADTWVDISADGTGFWAGAVTDAAGVFSMTVTPATGYRLTAYPGKTVFEQGFWRAGEDDPLTPSGRDGALVGDIAQATLVDASGGVELNILVPKPRSISGRVTDLQAPGVRSGGGSHRRRPESGRYILHHG